MKILVCNVGSTSLKSKLFDMPSEAVLAECRMDRIGSGNSSFLYSCDASAHMEKQDGVCLMSYTDGIQRLMDCLLDDKYGALASVGELSAVVFKTVMSLKYRGVHRITDDLVESMRRLNRIAPAHNPPYVEAIEVFRRMLPDTPMVASFETAFHATIPDYARLYSVDYDWYETYGVEKLGFHGASHSYVAQYVEARYRPGGRTISCHLGGSSSLCAIRDGKSIDNSFGFTPQGGVLHGNRNGDIDPFIIPYMAEQGMSLDEIVVSLGKRGGLYGISGVSNDMRDIEAAAAEGNARAKLALDMYCYSVLKYIGSYYMALGGLDCIAFTGGIGEKSASVRARVLKGLSHIGVVPDEEKNRRNEEVVSAPDSSVLALVIPANEELVLARNSYRLLTEAAG